MSPEVPWSEITDRAGQSSAIAARARVKGSCNFFGQSVWPNRDGQIAPFHGPHVLSERGMQQAQGSFEIGRTVELNDSAHNPPPRGRRDLPVPTAKPGDEYMPLTPGRRKRSEAHRRTFDGSGEVF